MNKEKNLQIKLIKKYRGLQENFCIKSNRTAILSEGRVEKYPDIQKEEGLLK